jgi:hypothetical protein
MGRPTVLHRHRRVTDGADSRLAKDNHVDIACSDPVNVATYLFASREGDRVLEPLGNCLKCFPTHVSPVEMPCQFTNQRTGTPPPHRSASHQGMILPRGYGTVVVEGPWHSRSITRQ